MEQGISEDPSTFTMHTFSFDRIYPPEATQEEVYESTARHSVMSILEVLTIFYKLHMFLRDTTLRFWPTARRVLAKHSQWKVNIFLRGAEDKFLIGFKYNSGDPQRGIIPRSMEEIFKFIENSSNSQVSFP
jgi:hypothetical protein